MDEDRTTHMADCNESIWRPFVIVITVVELHVYEMWKQHCCQQHKFNIAANEGNVSSHEMLPVAARATMLPLS